MTQLSGIDASFLYMETPETPMHVAGFTLYELPKGFKGSFHDHFRAFFAGRVHLIPIFGKKLARAVLELDHPGWVDAGELDLEYHIRSATLSAPGNWKQLEEMVASLHSNPLDRSRPLWQFHVIEGIEGGRVALYSKVHHAAVDGGAGMVITKALYDMTVEPRQVEPPPPRQPVEKPAAAERAVSGAADLIGAQLMSMPETMCVLLLIAGVLMIFALLLSNLDHLCLRLLFKSVLCCLSRVTCHNIIIIFEDCNHPPTRKVL